MTLLLRHGYDLRDERKSQNVSSKALHMTPCNCADIALVEQVFDVKNDLSTPRNGYYKNQ